MTSQIFTVSEVTSDLKGLIEDNFHHVSVLGELSNVKRHSSGHLYFTLKDAVAQLGSVMWRMQAGCLPFVPEDGMQVVVTGHLSFYPPQGKVQVYADTMTLAGEGALQAAFDALKKKLELEGLFLPERKRAISLLPRKVGIITSETGAVIHDLVRNLKRRFSSMDIVFAPAKVQGEGAAEDLAEKIAWMNARSDVDVLIVGRGGGSLEDLWAFNEEVLCRAVFASRIPVISAVGHESDVTLCDHVADVRASTPTGAAELAVPLRDDLFATIEMNRDRLRFAWDGRLSRLKDRLRYARSRARDPRQVFLQYRNTLTYCEQRSVSALLRVIENGRRALLRLEKQRVHPRAMLLAGKHRVNHAREMMKRQMNQLYTERKTHLVRLSDKLALLSPQSVLDRGYAIVFKNDATHTQKIRAMRSVQECLRDDLVTIRLSDGCVQAFVKSVDL